MVGCLLHLLVTSSDRNPKCFEEKQGWMRSQRADLDHLQVEADTELKEALKDRPLEAFVVREAGFAKQLVPLVPPLADPLLFRFCTWQDLEQAIQASAPSRLLGAPGALLSARTHETREAGEAGAECTAGGEDPEPLQQLRSVAEERGQMTQKELFAIIGDMPQTSPNCAAKCFRVRPRGSSSKAGRPGGRAPVSRGPCAGNRQSLQSLPTRVLQATCRSSRKRGRLAKPTTVGLTATLRHRHHIGQSWQERCDGCSEIRD